MLALVLQAGAPAAGNDCIHRQGAGGFHQQDSGVAPEPGQGAGNKLCRQAHSAGARPQQPDARAAADGGAADCQSDYGGRDSGSWAGAGMSGSIEAVCCTVVDQRNSQNLV